MKKNLFLAALLSFTIATASYAQVTTTPEVPKNYKPKPKELLPMPGELTDAMIFPVLGKYSYVDKDGNTSDVSIYRDVENKGVIWVNGLGLGKFKADLRASPATYKIPVQKTLQNDVASDMAVSDEASSDHKKSARFSGKSLQEGTLIFDSLSNKLYINVGNKFNEENPTYVFPEMLVNEEVVVEEATAAPAATEAKPKKKPIIKGTTYVLTKVLDESTVAAAPAAQ